MSIGLNIFSDFVKFKLEYSYKQNARFLLTFDLFNMKICYCKCRCPINFHHGANVHSTEFYQKSLF